MKLQLLDPDGNIVHEVTSAFDGFYLFDRVLPGRYILRVDPEQVERLRLEAPPEQRVTLDSGEVVSGVDLVLEELAKTAFVPLRGNPGLASASGEGQ